MPGTFQTADWVSARVVANIKNKLVIAEGFSKAHERDFEKEFAIGDSVRVKYPDQGLIREGLTYIGASPDRKYTTITVDNFFGIDLEWDSIEKALSMERSLEEIEEQYIEPRAATIAQEIDSRAARFAYLNTNNVIGALGVTPTTLDTYNQARTRIFENAGWASAKRRSMVITPQMVETAITGTARGLFNTGGQENDIFREGIIGTYGGFKWMESMSLYQHTSGIWTTVLSSTTVSGSGQSGSSLLVAATTGDTFVAGDIITIAAVNNVNPRTKRSTGRLKQFKIMANATAAASAATLTIFPEIIGPGDPYQNVDALPLTAAVVQMWPGTTMVNGAATTGTLGMAYTDEAFALVGIDLPMPKKSSMQMCEAYTDPDTGIQVSILQDFDFDARKWKTRMDVALGFGRLRADECAVLVAGLR